MENRCKAHREEKTRSEVEHRVQLEQSMEEIPSCSKELEDLKYMLAEKERREYELKDELTRSRNMLDEKLYEQNRLANESVAKSNRVIGNMDQVTDV